MAKNALKIDFIYNIVIKIIVCRCVMIKSMYFFVYLSKKMYLCKKINKRKIKVMVTTKEYYELKNFDFDKFYEFYQKNVEIKHKRLMSRDVMERKCSFFIHNFISRQLSSVYGIAYLNIDVLQHAIGRGIDMILDFLKKEGLVCVKTPYIQGVKSRGYEIKDLDENIICSNKPYFYPYRPYVVGLEKKLNTVRKKNDNKYGVKEK